MTSLQTKNSNIRIEHFHVSMLVFANSKGQEKVMSYIKDDDRDVPIWDLYWLKCMSALNWPGGRGWRVQVPDSRFRFFKYLFCTLQNTPGFRGQLQYQYLRLEVQKSGLGQPLFHIQMQRGRQAGGQMDEQTDTNKGRQRQTDHTDRQESVSA